jgi:hypothetical protein
VRAAVVLAIAVVFLTTCTAAPPTLPAKPTASPTASPLSTVVATPAATGRGGWTADTGIYGTNFHYGPPGYICGVGYNLSYSGGAPLTAVDVAVLFPDAFAAHVAPSSVDRAIGWQRPAAVLVSPAIHDAEWLSRVGDAVGGLCQSGPNDLDSLRGTLLRVTWETAEGSYEQLFKIEDIRGEMTACGAPDGRVHISWTDPSRGC